MKRLRSSALVAITALGVLLFLGQPVQAQSATQEQNPIQLLVQKLMQAFNLNPKQVETVVNEWQAEHHAARQVEMLKRREEYLSKLVAEGKLTEAQKQAIIAKQNELRNLNNSAEMWKKTPQERQAIREKKRAELDAWAQSQGIDPSLLRNHGFGFGRGKGMSGGDASSK
ncbi:MAG: hypothetical protein N2691_00120 [Patescibacteria group bacterium]|nr:hypothetical protein [Patescibacteria group bacterium]